MKPKELKTKISHVDSLILTLEQRLQCWLQFLVQSSYGWDDETAPRPCLFTHSHTHYLSYLLLWCDQRNSRPQDLFSCCWFSESFSKAAYSLSNFSLIQNAYHAVSTYTHTAKYTCMRVWTMTNNSCFLSGRKEKTLHIWLLWLCSWALWLWTWLVWLCSAKFFARRDRSHCWFDLIWVHWRMARRRGEAPQTVDSSAFVYF